MSIKAMNWAWTQDLPPAQKLTLLALADTANDSGECWPGLVLIAQKCGISKRTVQRNIRHFKETGLMTIKTRFTPKGRQTSNTYFLQLDRGDNLSPLKKSSQKKKSDLSRAGVTAVVTKGHDTMLSCPEPPQESKQQPLHYPKLAVAERHSIAALLDGILNHDAQALLDELTAAIEHNTIRVSSVGWFRALVDKYRSGKFTPTHGIGFADRRNNSPKSRLPKYKPIARATPINSDVASNALDKLKKSFG